MADRGNHYERAFEEHLRALRVACIPVMEARRTIDEERTIKSLDFIVTTPDQRTLLVDVKGRRLTGNRLHLENWATKDDVESLRYWQGTFSASVALLVFVYHLSSDVNKTLFDESFSYADRHYGCLAIAIDDFAAHMRERSPKWQTLGLPQRTFRDVARPFSNWLTFR